MLEPYDGKPSRTVLRGGRARKGPVLPGVALGPMRKLPAVLAITLVSGLGCNRSPDTGELPPPQPKPDAYWVPTRSAVPARDIEVLQCVLRHLYRGVRPSIEKKDTVHFLTLTPFLGLTGPHDWRWEAPPSRPA
jgi:hypothetical protein